MAKVELNSVTLSIQSLYRMFRDGEFYVNRQYQRKLVWTLEEKQKLIDSILSDFPVPLVLLAKRATDGPTYDIIDGLQRLHTIFSFIENAFCTDDGRNFDIRQLPRAVQAAKEDGRALSQDDDDILNANECAALSEYTLPITIVERASQKDVINIFERINSYGRRLSDQEQRQAGLSSSFSRIVRHLSCEIRGDVSEDNVPLSMMPEISVQGVRTVHGYGISAEDTFWTKQGVLHSGSLRDSLDEQTVADIVACILNKDPIQRSKAALNKIYDSSQKDHEKFERLLSKYGEDDFKRDFLTVFDNIRLTCDHNKIGNLQTVISKGAHHNEISTIFTALFMAYFELIVLRNMEICDFDRLVRALGMLNLATLRKAIDPDVRRANVNSIKGAIQDAFVEADVKEIPLGKPLVYTFENSLRRSRIELPHYEFKQGLFNLAPKRKFQKQVLDDIVKTICGMANIESGRDSYIYIGVTDKAADAERVAMLDQLAPYEFEGRHIVGLGREAKLDGLSLDDYVMKIKNTISSSELSAHLKHGVMSKLDCFVYNGFDVLRIVVPGQNEMSFLGNACYSREGSSTVEIAIKEIPFIARRFQ